MIVTLIAQERNLGIVTLSDHLISILGKNNITVFGWNYLLTDYTNILNKINEHKTSKSILIKYIIPKQRFTNPAIKYPKELECSDLIFYVPTYKEELETVVPLKFFKGADNPMVIHIKKFYGQ